MNERWGERTRKGYRERESKKKKLNTNKIDFRCTQLLVNFMPLKTWITNAAN